METSRDIKDIKYNSKKKKKRSENNPLQNILDFVIENIRYFAAGMIFILMIIVLAFFMKQNDAEPAVQYPENGEETFEIDAYPAVVSLIEQYYNCYANGDFETLQTIASPFSEHELAYMEILSRYVESYQNLVCYTKSGLDSGSYMVNVYLEMKFEGVDTLASGLDFFYVRTNEDGSLYIDNSYSEYNMKNNDNPLDINIHNLIKEHEQQEDLIALLNETTVKFNEAMSADANLSLMVNETVPAAISAWMADLTGGVALQPETETETEIETETESEVETETEPEQPSQPEPDPGMIVFPEGTVITIEGATNVRKEMSTESSIVETIYKGTKVTVVMSYSEGWTKVKWDNKTGYIRSDLLQ